MNKAGNIIRIAPVAGIPGGEIAIECEGLDTSEPSQCAVLIDGEVAPLVALSSRRALAIVPELKRNRTSGFEIDDSDKNSETVEIILESQGELSEPASF